MRCIMTKKDKLYLLAFVLSSASIGVAIILRLANVNFYDAYASNISASTASKAVINAIFAIIQFVLIIGCVVREPPKKLIAKTAPYFLLNALLPCLPETYYYILNVMILFVVCIAIRPCFSSVARFAACSAIIPIMQIALIWLRTGVLAMSPLFPDLYLFLIINIDQIILLFLLYLISRKRGDKFV
jgi:hypothetical protein